MKNLIGISARDTCPACGSRQKVVTLPNCLEWDEKQETWVPLSVSTCGKCGYTTIYTFHPEMFTTLATQNKNEDKQEKEKEYEFRGNGPGRGEQWAFSC